MYTKKHTKNIFMEQLVDAKWDKMQDRSIRILFNDHVLPWLLSYEDLLWKSNMCTIGCTIHLSRLRRFAIKVQFHEQWIDQERASVRNERQYIAQFQYSNIRVDVLYILCYSYLEPCTSDIKNAACIREINPWLKYRTVQHAYVSYADMCKLLAC